MIRRRTEAWIPAAGSAAAAAARVVVASVAALFLTAALATAAPHTAEPDGDGYRVRFDPAELELEETPAGVRVHYRDAALPGDPDAPALPLVTVMVEIPAAETAVRVIATAEDEHEVASGVGLAGAGLPERVDREPEIARPAGARLGLATARIAGGGFGRGHRLVAVELAPVRWIPDITGSGSLVLATAIRFRLELEPASPFDRPLPQHRFDAVLEDTYTATLARALGRPVPVPARAAPPVKNLLEIAFPPSVDGAAVPYIIVTSQALSPSFQTLAHWKTQRGRNAAVITREWIAAHYPNGADPAEQLRFFLTDAYQNWGTMWVLLGGDTDVVPTRFAVSTLFASPEDPELIPDRPLLRLSRRQLERRSG